MAGQVQELEGEAGALQLGLSRRGLWVTLVAALLLGLGLAFQWALLVSMSLAAFLVLLVAAWWAASLTGTWQLRLRLPRRGLAERGFPLRMELRNGHAWRPSPRARIGLLLGVRSELAFECPPLAPGQAASFSAQAPPLGRGVYGDWWAELESDFPFALILSKRRLKVVAEPELLLTPRPLYPQEIRRFGHGASPLDCQSSRRPGPEEEFLALRPYRPGDRLRRIHWATSSRGRGLTVREVEFPGNWPETCVVVMHSCGREGLVRPANFERALSFLVGVASHFVRQGQPLELRCDFWDYQPLSLQSRRNLRRLGDRLAAAERRNDSPPTALQAQLRHLSPQTHCLLVSDLEPSHWPELQVPAGGLTLIDITQLRGRFSVGGAESRASSRS